MPYFYRLIINSKIARGIISRAISG